MPGGLASRLGDRNDDPYDLRALAAAPGPKLARQEQSSSPSGTSRASSTPTSAATGTSGSGRLTTTGSGTGTSPSVSSTSSPTPTPTTRIITDDLFPPPTSTASTGGERTRNGSVPQTVLMWVFAVIALGVIGIIVIWRWSCIKMRRREQRALRVVRAGRRNGAGTGDQQREALFIRDSNFRNTWDRSTQPITLSPTFLHTGIMPLVDAQGNLITAPRREGRDRRVRGADVDEGGRRAGRLVNDEGEDIADGEELPAYDGDKGPPGYHTLALQQVEELLSGRGGRNRTSSRMSQRSGEALPLTQVGQGSRSGDLGGGSSADMSGQRSAEADAGGRSGVVTVPAEGTTTATTTTPGTSSRGYIMYPASSRSVSSPPLPPS